MMNTDAPNASGSRSGGSRGVSPALDATLDLLSNRRRRYVLYYLREQDRAVSLDELAERVIAWERDADDRSSPVESGDADDSRVMADLHHCQLPRLEEAGAVSYDAEEGYASLAATDEEPLTEYLDLAASEEDVR